MQIGQRLFAVETVGIGQAEQGINVFGIGVRRV
jgi:hypothetical protein